MSNPDCPECETDVFVAGSKRTRIDYVCEFCGTEFNRSASHRGQRGRRSDA